MKWMTLECRKCESVICIDETKRRRLKNLCCPECWEESYYNWIIIWDRKKPVHDIDRLLKQQEIDNES